VCRIPWLHFSFDLTEQAWRGWPSLRKLGVMLIPATAPDFFTEDTPTAVLVRQMLGAIAQFEKASVVAKLKAARDRKIAAGEKCGGRKSYAEARPEMVGAGPSVAPSRSRSSASLLTAGRGGPCRARPCRVNRQAVRSCGRSVHSANRRRSRAVAAGAFSCCRRAGLVLVGLGGGLSDSILAVDPQVIAVAEEMFLHRLDCLD
jgi:hypothetical protein